MKSNIIPRTSNTRESKFTYNVDDLCLGWWLEVGAADPPCINFYGPFESKAEAEAAKLEYSGEAEQTAPIIYSLSKFCQPRQRIIKEQELTIQDLEGCSPTFFETLLTGPRIY